MKRLLVSVVAFCLGGAAAAQSKESIDSCRSYSEAARTVMENRQAGTKMAELMDWAANNKGHEEISKYMVIAAYKKPAYRTPENQERTIINFENDMFLECITAFKELERK